MGNSKSKRNKKDQQYPLPTINVKLQMKYIINYWIRKCGKNPSFYVTMDIISLIIDTYTYQKIFDSEHNIKVNNISTVNTTSEVKHGELYDHSFKVVLTVNCEVGKSQFMSRYVDDMFSDNYSATIGIDFRFQTVQIDDITIKLQIWDTS